MRNFLSVVVAMFVFGIGSAFASTFSDSGIKTWGEPGNGRIHASGTKTDLDEFVRNIQFCPDQIKYRKDFTCGLNWPISVERISAEEAVFQLDMKAVANGQRAFNFKNAKGQWSQVSSGKAGQNLVVEMSDPNPDSEDGRGGCHYTYIGDLPAGSYVPYKPELCGGYAVVKTARAAVPAKATVAVATNQSAAAAHNSAAATNQSAAANNSSQANATSFLNINQVATGGKGKKSGKNTAIIYAPNASQKVQNNNIKGNSADVKVYNNKGGKSGIKNVITYVGPSFQTIHIGVSGAESYDPYACAKCHSDVAKEDERIKKLLFKKMSCAINDACNDKDNKNNTKVKK